MNSCAGCLCLHSWRIQLEAGLLSLPTRLHLTPSIDFKKTLFLSYFSSTKKPLQVLLSHLFSLKKGENEQSLREYLTQLEGSSSNEVDMTVIAHGHKNGYHLWVLGDRSAFKWSLALRILTLILWTTLLLEKATQYINAEEADQLESALKISRISSPVCQTSSRLGLFILNKKQKISLLSRLLSSRQKPALACFCAASDSYPG